MYVIDSSERPPAFEFSIDGDAYSVPLLSALPADEMRELSQSMAGKDARGAMTEYAEKIRALFDENAPGAVSRLTLAQWQGLSKAYQEASGITAGE